MFKNGDRVRYTGADRIVLGKPYLACNEIVTITAVSPDQKNLFISVENGNEYGWIPATSFVLTAMLIDSQVSFFGNVFLNPIKKLTAQVC